MSTQEPARSALDRFLQQIRAAIDIDATPPQFTEHGLRKALADFTEAADAARLHLLHCHPLECTSGPIAAYVTHAGNVAAEQDEHDDPDFARHVAEGEASYLAGVALGLLLADTVQL